MNIILLSTSVPEVTYGGPVSIWELTRWPFVVTVTKNVDTSLYGAVRTDNGFILYEANAIAGTVPQTFADTLSAAAIVILRQALPTSTIPGLVQSTGQAAVTFANNGGAGESWASAPVADTGVSTNSTIQVYIMSATTADHTPEEHRILDLYSTKAAGNIVAGVGFDILINTELRLRGAFQVSYSRN